MVYAIINAVLYCKILLGFKKTRTNCPVKSPYIHRNIREKSLLLQCIC